jgi:acyl dehydratase
VITKVLGFDGSKSSETYVESDKGVGKLSEEFGGKVKAGGWCGHGAWGLGVGGLVVDGVGGLEVGLSVGFSGFEDIGRERR